MRYPMVPVIMYHSIGKFDPEWRQNYLTCPWQVFEDHLRWLKRCGFHSISLQDLCEYKKTGKLPHDRPIILTFDDGYLDNWFFAYPLLKKYGFKGVIFINPESVDPGDIVRTNSDKDLRIGGFLSWREIEIMERSGVMDIQSHSMTHAWHFCDNKIIDFYSPGANRHPSSLDRIPRENIPHGVPIYEYGRSLGIRRYFEDRKLTKSIVDYAKKKRKDFFSMPGWKEELLRQVENYKSREGVKDRYETDEEQGARFEYELKESKEVLEERLGKKIDFLCWPGGAKTEKAINLSRDIGYKAFTCSALKDKGVNVFLEDPSRIYRMGAPHIKLRNRIYYLGGIGLVLSIFSFKGSYTAALIQKIVKLFNAFLIVAGRRRVGHE